MMRHSSDLIAAGLVAVSLVMAPRIGYAEELDHRERAEEFIDQGLEKLMQTLDLLIGSIPQYEMPFVDENGDIIIRRRRDAEPGEPTPGKKAPKADVTNT